MTTDDPGRKAILGGYQTPSEARLDDEQLGALAGLVAPILRERNETVGAEDPDFHDAGVMAMAETGPLLHALYAAGVLVFEDTSDRAHLRRNWTAISTALIHLSQDRPLSPAVLAAVPRSHRIYLMGHQAAHAQLAEQWASINGAAAVLEGIMARGTAPTPVDIGEVLALLGGENPFAGGRPPIADPWWGCWMEPAADPASFNWEAYRKTCAPEAPIDGLGDLCAFLGGSWDAENPGATSLTGMILLLIVKAQNTPDRFTAIARAFPREVTAWRTWNTMRPTPTAAELYAELAGELPVLEDAPAAAGAVVASVDDETLAAEVFDLALEYAAALVRSAGDEETAPALDLARLAPRADAPWARLPWGCRSYALPWPAGTRALYDPIDGVEVRPAGTDKTGMADVEVIARTLFVPSGDGERFPVGTVRVLGYTDKRGRRYWICRHCQMGATGAVSAEAEKAECLGHEAICPDQDKIAASVPAGEDRHA